MAGTDIFMKSTGCRTIFCKYTEADQHATLTFEAYGISTFQSTAGTSEIKSNTSVQ